jgi:hypothetical protein
MSIEVERATEPCCVCGAHVSELRRNRCWSCYTKWMELRPVGRGASCSVCAERRRENLRMVELHAKSVPLCHNCAARVVKLSQVPPSIEGIRQSLRRDRRANDRRDDGLDQRIFPRERRVGDRRGPPRAGHRGDTDPFMAMPDFDDLVIEIEENDIELIEQTVVRERPAPPLTPSKG